MPAANRKPIRELLAKAALFFGVADTDHQMGVPPEIDDQGNLKVIDAQLQTYTVENPLDVVRGKAGLLNSGVFRADKAVKLSAGEVYWLTVSDSAALSIEINDSPDDSGIDVWGFDMPADGYAHFIFDPPIECANGIWVDVSTATCKVTVGYI